MSVGVEGTKSGEILLCNQFTYMSVKNLDLSTGRVVNNNTGAALAIVPIASKTPGWVSIESIAMEGSLDNRVSGKDG